MLRAFFFARQDKQENKDERCDDDRGICDIKGGPEIGVYKIDHVMLPYLVGEIAERSGEDKSESSHQPVPPPGLKPSAIQNHYRYNQDNPD